MQTTMGEVRRLLKEAMVPACDYCGGTDDVRSMGTDANGEPDSPDVCAPCREELEAGNAYDSATGLYQPMSPTAHRGY